MTTTRTLCRVLGAALQVRGVERHAARLVRDGYLPRAGEDVNFHDAATLLLVVGGAPRPDQASHVVETLMGLPPRAFSWTPNNFFSSFISDIIFGEHWTFAPNLDRCMAPTAAEEIGDILANEDTQIHCERLVVEQGGANVTLYIRSMMFGEDRTYRMHYGGVQSSSGGLRTIVEIPQASIDAVITALRPSGMGMEKPRTLTVEEMEARFAPPKKFTERNEPIEQTEKRLAALYQFPATPPAGNA